MSKSSKSKSLEIKKHYPCKVIFGNKIQAVYRPCENPMYRHNPFIEALPPLFTPEEAIRKMCRYPAYDEKECQKPALHRLDAVQEVSNYYEPLSMQVELSQCFSRIIRNGYFSRNPLSASWKRQIRSAFPKIDWDEKDPTYIPVIYSSAAGFSISGPSGIGKSIAVVSALSLFPQVIIHSEYESEPFVHTQLVWLVLECPQDGSPRGICLSFFWSIDQILGSNYFERFRGRATIDELIPLMAKIAGLLGLGVLVIDEIQRLSRLKGGGSAQMEDFFIQISNTIGVPIIQVGTPDALPVMTKKFAFARRNTGQGDMLLSNMKNDDEWNFFVQGLWRYQWTYPPSPLTDELSDALYFESQGIIDIAVKLYQIVQWHAIGSENERITPALIKSVAKKCLKLVKPALDALRSNDPNKIEEFRDVCIPPNQLDEYLKRARKQLYIRETIGTTRNSPKASATDEVSDDDAFLARVTQWLVDAGVKPEIAYECAEKSIISNAHEKKLDKVFQDAWHLAMPTPKEQLQAEQALSKKIDGSSSAKNIYRLEDMREIISKAKKGTSNYDALKSSGFIKDAREFLDAEVLQN